MQRKWVAVWTLVAVLAGGAEAVALLDPASGDTLSEFVRTGIRHSPEIGGAAFLGGLAWLGWHILRKVR